MFQLRVAMFKGMPASELLKLFLSLPVSACLLDRDFRYVAANQKYAAMLGVALEDLKDRCVGDFCPPEIVANVQRDFHFLSNGIDVPDHEIEFRGAHYLVSVTLLALEAAEEFPAVFVTLSDISGRKRLEMELAETNSRLSDAYEKIKRLAATDPLTGVLNRNGFQDFLDIELARLQQENLPVSLGLIDVDWFKRYNDTYGHPAGDTVLQGVASLISSQIRSACDGVARYGGEEFVVLMPGATGHQAFEILQRINLAVARQAFEHKSSPFGRVTISAGVAFLPSGSWAGGSDGVYSLLLKQADEALYAAKSAGRNRVHFSGLNG